ncbi:hypothetical protein [Pseudomonas sp. 5P_3.1_Bac2]|uniref:hypothetical protein n=1 Tax=Pseudomonas sp. 5P_3.1_Bac2 TaxID=2971617 RepID=UPI0021C9CB60|nr:hypothetical protein [Pseudomonas sp. 5P_3.1_Bac2]MCU1718568.1 hypothetical protein [Pseudomonas sp. 5P_3.1_Bac2]
MNLNALQDVIARAQSYEIATSQLAMQLRPRLATLHRSIRLPAQDAEGTLLGFIHGYIGRVPEMLQAIYEVALEAQIDAQIKPLLHVAEQFFLAPPQFMADVQGLEALLDEAYFAHRIVEEINDRYIRFLGVPLLPLDTTVANLVAHQLIGEEFANQLDDAVLKTLEHLLNPASFAQPTVAVYRQHLLNGKTHAAWQRWPCLSSELGVELQLKRDDAQD